MDLGMQAYNKLELAAAMIVEAAKECRSGSGEIGFVKSILLAGAVNNILSPLLAELGIDCLHTELSKYAAAFNGVDVDALSNAKREEEIGKGLRFYRFTYNSLKHAGSRRVAASEDLEFQTNLEEEANHLIDAALIDFAKLKVCPFYAHEKFPPELLELLSGPWNFPALDTEGRN